MKLLPFQIGASTQIAERFREYMRNPLMVDKFRTVPFYQNLSSITGSGKTLILADTIELIRGQLPIEPIVLWLSKGKVVVWQTYQNLSAGKYQDLIGGYEVKPLQDCTPSDVEDGSRGLVLIATAAKFNQKDKDKGDRKIFRAELDTASTSLWDTLKARIDKNGNKRPFIVIYDEGHNLSDQQTKLLLDLTPDAIIGASATLRVPEELNPIIDRLNRDKGWKDEDIVTSVRSVDVVESGLIKQSIRLGGYVTPMELAIDDLLDDMRALEDVARSMGLPFTPKAIYVSNTNVVPTATVEDAITTPFEKRQARPILIWRYLVEQKGVPPEDIAVYCNLKFGAKAPPPSNFVLFAGGDTDYDRFISGNYKHIIFNLTLQEGWDDSACYFAYVDKDMGSKDQIVQVIGRVLRQPEATHYGDERLNTAHFYIRTDEKAVFSDVLSDVRAKIAADSPEVKVTTYRSSGRGSDRPTISPRKKKFVPEIAINSQPARGPIKHIVDKILDYRKDGSNTVGKGGKISVLHRIGSNGNGDEEWIEIEHSNRVTARWVFVREIQKYYGKAVNLCDIEHPKFDALLEYHSLAADNLREAAIKVVDAYLDHSIVVQNSMAPVEVTDVLVNRDQMVRFKNAVHEGYSGLNEFEKAFAKALDRTKRVWSRNPSRGFFEIPLLDKGVTKNFNPDFLVWVDKALVAIDPKADHLIMEAAARKLFFVQKVDPDGPDLLIRMVTKGNWSPDFERVSVTGYSTWVLKNGRVYPIHSETLDEAVQICLRLA